MSCRPATTARDSRESLLNSLQTVPQSHLHASTPALTNLCQARVVGEQQQSKPRSWVGSWARSEEFWRGVTSKMLAGFIVLLVGAFFAAVAGLIDWSIVGIVVLGIIVLIGTALLALAVGV